MEIDASDDFQGMSQRQSKRAKLEEDTNPSQTDCGEKMLQIESMQDTISTDNSCSPFTETKSFVETSSSPLEPETWPPKIVLVDMPVMLPISAETSMVFTGTADISISQKIMSSPKLTCKRSKKIYERSHSTYGAENPFDIH